MPITFQNSSVPADFNSVTSSLPPAATKRRNSCPLKLKCKLNPAEFLPNDTSKKTAAHSIATRLKLRLKQSGKMLHSINRVSQFLTRLQSVVLEIDRSIDLNIDNLRSSRVDRFWPYPDGAKSYISMLRKRLYMRPAFQEMIRPLDHSPDYYLWHKHHAKILSSYTSPQAGTKDHSRNL